MSEVFNLKDFKLTGPEISLIAKKLKEGATLVYPTETFYGLGGTARLPEVAEKIFQLKGRDGQKTLPMVAADLEMVFKFFEPDSVIFPKLAEQFWPGPLTIVVKVKEGLLPDEVIGLGRTAAVRVPPLDWLKELIKQTEGPLISTSANLSGQPPLDSFGEVYRIFASRVDIYIDGGKTPGEKPSTIIDLTGPETVCLREGQIPFSRILDVLDNF
ncbi:MAG: L-threonylcarbamoyladenylate synthase [Acidobacteriota bacterium]|nr:L-threonylcarbamoyladenylate synthase [Acidobacteriota bacterium]MDW3229181.1 L-threonylcarbamoyladenylate synthase [Acidobacteriota bacterium]MDY0231083.1 L-threonylcarbamoyladenylate synthase [Candidatus Saccharicenans sp.]